MIPVLFRGAVTVTEETPIFLKFPTPTLASRELERLDQRLESKYAPLLSKAGRLRRWWLTWCRKRERDWALEKMAQRISYMLR